jgi:Alpha-L-fucosidase
MPYYKAKPTVSQLEWADMELGVIIHYLMDIYNPGYTGFKTNGVREHMPPSIFNPIKLDTDQWIASAAAMGAKYAVFVANHCTGFSLWQTKVNDYSVASSPWKNGKGDILADFIKSCEKYNIRPGIYYSTGCNGYYDINDDKPQDYNSWYYQYYVKCVERQITELWSEYGKLFEIWFDGGIIPVEKGGPNLVPILNKFQPDAICFQGPKSHPHNVRWVGNEDGKAPENCWATTNNGEPAMDGTFDHEAAGRGDPNGKYWWPAETDMGNRNSSAFGGGWAWKEGEENKVYTPEHLLECYINSVGCNSNLLIGMAIAKDGSFQDQKQFEDFGTLIQKTFGTPKAIVSEKVPSATVTLKTETPVKFDYIVIREDITDGQNIRKFKIKLNGHDFYESECVGHKRIIRAPGATASEITFEATEFASLPTLRDLAVY